MTAKLQHVFLLSLAIMFINNVMPNTVVLRAQSVGGGQKQINVDRNFTGLTLGDTYTLDFEVLSINKPVTISASAISVVVNVPGTQSFTFSAASTTLTLNFFHQSSGAPARIELDNLILAHLDESIISSCKPVSNADYRFAFNGMEKDDEVKNGIGNHYTSAFRQYDPRLARWHTIDPKLTASWSPYSAMSNSPVFFADPDGDTVVVKHEGTDYVYTPGMDVDDSYPDFVKETFNSLNESIINDQSEGCKVQTYLDELHESTDKLLIVEITEGGSTFTYAGDKEYPEGYDLGVIRWNPDEGFQDVKVNEKGQAINEKGRKARKPEDRIGIGPVFSPDRALFHEVGHAREKLKNPDAFYDNRINKKTNAKDLPSQWTNWEEHRNIHDMNEIFGEERTMHRGKGVPVNVPVTIPESP